MSAWGWLLVGAVIGAVVDQFLNAYLQRPLLWFTGSGGGSFVQIQNKPGLFGFRLEGTAILGKQLSEYREIGFPTTRAAAVDCHAWLVDAENDRHLALLHWQDMKTGTILDDQHIIINNAEQYWLMVFAPDPADPNRYYPWTPDPARANQPLVPHPSITFTGPHRFYVLVKYANGSKRLRIHADVERDYGSTQYRFLFRPW
jgi:hypothetical protein